MSVIEMGKVKVKPKKISVSVKRQITIPIEYYNALNIGDEVECMLVDDSIVIKPIKENSLDEYHPGWQRRIYPAAHQSRLDECLA